MDYCTILLEELYSLFSPIKFEENDAGICPQYSEFIVLK